MVTDEMVEKACLAYWGDKNMNGMFVGKTREGVFASMRKGLEAALSTDAEPVAWIVRNPTVARTHSKTQAHKSSKEALYPVSRGEDAREYARLMGGECLPLYTHSLEAEQEENAAEGKCQENDGCPTEKAVLQRFWRRHHNAEPVKTAPAVAVKAKLIADLREMAESITYAEDPSRVMREAADALSAQVQDVAGWQPIDTADKEQILLLWNGKRVYEGYWGTTSYNRSTREYEQGWVSHPSSGDTKPTHWMPLPASPASKHGDAE